MNTFEQLYLKFKDNFIYNHGKLKFETVEDKIYKSGRLELLFNQSIKKRTAPSQADIGVAVQCTTYFIFAGSDTMAMGEFIATKFWNETVNSQYHLCTEHDLYFKGESILKKWSKHMEFFK